MKIANLAPPHSQPFKPIRTIAEAEEAVAGARDRLDLHVADYQSAVRQKKYTMPTAAAHDSIRITTGAGIPPPITGRHLRDSGPLLRVMAPTPVLTPIHRPTRRMPLITPVVWVAFSIFTMNVSLRGQSRARP